MTRNTALVQTGIRLPADLYRKVKVLAVLLGTTAQDFARVAIEKEVRRTERVQARKSGQN